MARPPLPIAAVRALTTLGGVAFLASAAWTVVAYATAFGRSAGPWSGERGLPAAGTNTLWFALFALHHSAFARAPVKRWVTALVSTHLERSMYVWGASALLAVVVWQWTPVPGQAWRVSGLAATALGAVQLGGVLLTLLAVRQLDVGSFAGMRPAPAVASLHRTGLYGLVRHPIYLAWLLMVWPTSSMTGSRLLFATVTTLYLIVAVPFEERTLRREFGSAYDDYRRAVRWRMLPGLY